MTRKFTEKQRAELAEAVADYVNAILDEEVERRGVDVDPSAYRITTAQARERIDGLLDNFEAADRIIAEALALARSRS